MPLKSPNEPYYTNQILAVFLVSLGPFAVGLSRGYMSPAIASMQNPIYCGGLGISDQQASWIVSSSFLGAILGSILGGLGMQLGRRMVLMTTAVPFTLSWLTIALSTNLSMVSAASFVAGTLDSCITMTTQVYVAEIAASEIRGRLFAVLEFTNQLGILIAFSAGAFLSWHQLALVVASASILFLLAQFFIPETPSTLLLRNMEQKAKKTLQWLRGPNADTRKEFRTIENNIAKSEIYRHNYMVSRWKSWSGDPEICYECLDNTELQLKRWPTGTVTTRTNVTPLCTFKLFSFLCIICIIMFFRRFTGGDFFLYYAVNIFRKTFWTLDSHLGAIATSGTQLITSCVFGLLVDKIGRKPLLIISGGMMFVALIGFGIFSYGGCAFAASGLYDWIPLICAFTLSIAFSLGIGPISSLLMVELLPLESRCTSSAIAMSFSYFCGFVNVKTAIDIKEHIGLYGLFWLYAGVTLLYIIFVVLLMFETKGTKIDEFSEKYVEDLFNSMQYEKENVCNVLSFTFDSYYNYDDEFCSSNKPSRSQSISQINFTNEINRSTSRDFISL